MDAGHLERVPETRAFNFYEVLRAGVDTDVGGSRGEIVP